MSRFHQINNTFGSMIRSHREKRRMTQAELAQAIGARSESFVGLVEAGKRGFNIDDLPSLAQALGLDPRSLIMVYLRDRHPGVFNALFADAEPPEVRPEAAGSYVPDIVFRFENLPREIRGPLEALIFSVSDLIKTAK